MTIYFSNSTSIAGVKLLELDLRFVGVEDFLEGISPPNMSNELLGVWWGVLLGEATGDGAGDTFVLNGRKVKFPPETGRGLFKISSWLGSLFVVRLSFSLLSTLLSGFPIGGVEFFLILIPAISFSFLAL